MLVAATSNLPVRRDPKERRTKTKRSVDERTLEKPLRFAWQEFAGAQTNEQSHDGERLQDREKIINGAL
jgi:hypothetical protein